MSNKLKLKPIPIRSAENMARMYGFDQIVIIARVTGKDGGECVTTYGVDKLHCSIAARMGDFLKYQVMGWIKNKEI